jgi:hypothetical protein
VLCVDSDPERLALHLAPAITSAAQLDKMLNMPEEKWDKTLNVGSRPCRVLLKAPSRAFFVCVVRLFAVLAAYLSWVLTWRKRGSS